MGEEKRDGDGDGEGCGRGKRGEEGGGTYSHGEVGVFEGFTDEVAAGARDVGVLDTFLSVSSQNSALQEGRSVR